MCSGRCHGRRFSLHRRTFDNANTLCLLCTPFARGAKCCFVSHLLDGERSAAFFSVFDPRSHPVGTSHQRNTADSALTLLVRPIAHVEGVRDDTEIAATVIRASPIDMISHLVRGDGWPIPCLRQNEMVKRSHVMIACNRISTGRAACVTVCAPRMRLNFWEHIGVSFHDDTLSKFDKQIIHSVCIDDLPVAISQQAMRPCHFIAPGERSFMCLFAACVLADAESL